MATEKYKHGVYATETATEMTETVKLKIAQVVIGTAPVHMLDNPASAVNKPVICFDIDDFRSKVGYSDDYQKYTVCQSAYASLIDAKVAPLVFINVLDPSKHFTEVAEKDYPVNDNSITINDDVIVSTLEIKKEGTPVEADKYIAEWADGSLLINFVESVEGSVTVKYNKTAPEKVTNTDVIGKWNTETDERTGAEAIRDINPFLGVVPSILTAPGWSEDELVGAVLDAKCNNINGSYKAIAISDIDSSKAKTRAAAIEEKKARAWSANSIAAYPKVQKGERIIALSSYIAALIMSLAAGKDSVTCDSPSNKEMTIDTSVLADGTPVAYDVPAGNELDGAGIVTVIARNGWYCWGNNTAAFPGTKDPKDRFIMTRNSFNWMENDFINTNFKKLDDALNPKMVEDCISDYNLKLDSYSTNGYLVGGKIFYKAERNTANTLLAGMFNFNTLLAGNIPGSVINNEFAYDTDTFVSKILGGAE